MTCTYVKAIQFGLPIPIEWNRFADDPFEGEVWWLATLKDRLLDRADKRADALAELNVAADAGLPINQIGEFVVGTACWPGLCQVRWAALALRISDGAAFVRLGDGTRAAPKGEALPDLIRRVNDLG